MSVHTKDIAIEPALALASHAGSHAVLQCDATNGSMRLRVEVAPHLLQKQCFWPLSYRYEGAAAPNHGKVACTPSVRSFVRGQPHSCVRKASLICRKAAKGLLTSLSSSA